MGLILSVLFCLSPLASAQTPEFYIAAVSPNGTMLAGVAKNSLFRIWDTKTGKMLFDLPDLYPSPFSVTWSPNNKRIAAAGGDNIIRLWCVDRSSKPECQPGSFLTQFSAGRGPLLSIAWNIHDVLATSSQEGLGLRTWDMRKDYEALAAIPWGDSTQIAWNPSGNRLAMAGSGGLFTIAADLVNDRATTYLSDQRIGSGINSWAVAWSPNGERIALGTVEGSIYLFDFATKDQIVALTGQTGTIHALAWNPDSVQLASASADGTIYIWDTEAEKLLRILSARKREVVTLQISWSYGGITLYYPDDRGGIAGLPKPSNTPTPTPQNVIPPCLRTCGEATATPGQ